MIWDYLIVGAGFAGAVLAERLSSQCGASCLVVDRRDHIGGNAFDCHDRAGVLIHPYGPHYFRTNADRIVEYLSQFTEWRQVEYRILSWTHGRYWQFPINLHTFEQLLYRPSTSEEMEAALAQWRIPIESPKNSEEVILSQVGERLYEMFFRNYTRKQWQRDPRELDPSVCGRIPIRTNRDDRYLSEKFQASPAAGYTAMFQKMLSHPKIQILLRTDFRAVRTQVQWRRLIFTGPIDEYYEHCFGPLPYRSLRFEPETLDREFFQPAMQVNYPNDHDFTRIVEMKHATGQKIPVTTIIREYPEAFVRGREPYYPIPAPEARALYELYAARAAAETDVSFVATGWPPTATTIWIKSSAWRSRTSTTLKKGRLSGFPTIRPRHDASALRRLDLAVWIRAVPIRFAAAKLPRIVLAPSHMKLERLHEYVMTARRDRRRRRFGVPLWKVLGLWKQNRDLADRICPAVLLCRFASARTSMDRDSRPLGLGGAHSGSAAPCRGA